MRTKATDKYEKKIQELITECQRKTNECHEAWMSLTTANEQLEKIRMELDNKTFQTRSLGNYVWLLHWAAVIHTFLISLVNLSI